MGRRQPNQQKQPTKIFLYRHVVILILPCYTYNKNEISPANLVDQ
jgi:hypothetical protein